MNSLTVAAAALVVGCGEPGAAAEQQTLSMTLGKGTFADFAIEAIAERMPRRILTMMHKLYRRHDSLVHASLSVENR